MSMFIRNSMNAASRMASVQQIRNKSASSPNKPSCDSLKKTVKTAPAATPPPAEQAKKIPYRAIRLECAPPATTPPARADEVNTVVKNHPQPYHKYFCDLELPPYITPRYQNIKCCIDLTPRRARKTPAASAAGNRCSSIQDANCQGTKDQCARIECPGCPPTRNPTKCVEVRRPDLCESIKAPRPSFHECLRAPAPYRRPDQCVCLSEMRPPCNPTLRRTTADR